MAAAASPPKLPFGDINILVVTDVHSFVAGHPHEADRDADFGDVLSFYQHIEEYCEEQDSDLWFFMNGDWVHGTGLAMDGNATMLVPLLKKMPWDAITLGNHESYKSGIVELMQQELVPHFGEGFVTSNALVAATMEPFGGARYRLLHGNRNTLLVFGFLYNLVSPSHLLHIARVQDVLEEDWFRLALRENEYDAICVLAHMDNDDPLIDLILSKIREHTKERMPVQFLTGHSHHRKQRKIGKDYWGHAMEAGGNLDTIGFVSIPNVQTAESVKLGESFGLFQWEFLNASKKVLTNAASVDNLWTPEGYALSEEIRGTRLKLGLDEVVGCPPRDFFMNRSIHAEDSLFRLWIERVAPSQVFDRKSDCAMIISSNNFRYDLRGSGRNDATTVDDIVAIVPYMESVVYIGEVPEWVIRRMNISMNTRSLNHKHLYPDYLLAGRFEIAGDKNKPYKLYTHEYNLPNVMRDLDRLHKHNYKPTTTQIRDTLYWLQYASVAWPCPGHNEPMNVKPWFADMKALHEEASDGSETSEDDDSEHETAVGKAGNDAVDGEDSKSDLHYEGYHGYIPPSTIEKFGDKLPPGITTSVPMKPTEKTLAPKATKKSNIKHSAAAHKAERNARLKKIKRIMIRIVGAILAISLLMIPLCGIYGVIFPDKRKNVIMSDEAFYDMKEMRAFQRRRQGGGHRPIQEIQLT